MGTNNLGRVEVSANQTSKETTLNDSDGRLDAALTSALPFVWSGAQTLKTATTDETQTNVAFVFSGSTSGSPSFKLGNIQRGLIVIVNDMAVTVPVTDYAGTDTVNCLAGTSTVLYLENDRLETIIASNGAPEAANDGNRYVRQSLAWSDAGGLVTTETGTTDSLTTADADDTILYTNAGAITVTLPLNSSQAIRIGSFIRLLQGSAAGIVTVSPTGGVTLNGATATNGVNTQLLLIKVGTDTWYGIAASGISDAAVDSNVYARRDGAWTDVGTRVNTSASATPTLALTDAYDHITLTNSGAITLQLPSNATTAFRNGTWIRLIQTSPTATITVSAGSGATVSGNTLQTSRQGDSLLLIKTNTNDWYVVAADSGGLYNVSGFFVTTPVANEVLLNHIFSQQVTFNDNFLNSVAHVATNPTASFVIDIQKNGASIGTLTIGTGGTVTFATTGTGLETFVSGDRLRMLAPATPDATIANLTWTLRGRK